MALTRIINDAIADTSITGPKIVTQSITGPALGIRAVSGNNIGTGAISANNFAGGGVTSNVLASNLSISTVRVAETANVFLIGIAGNVNIDVSNSSVYYFVANTTANVTFNFRANGGATYDGSTGTMNDLLKIGESSSVAIALKQGATRYRANLYIDNVLQTAYWLGNSQPLYQTTQQQSIDTYNITIIKTAPSTYTIMASNSTFGQANGQGVGGATQ